jgi:hypothetical protein
VKGTSTPKMSFMHGVQHKTRTKGAGFAAVSC